MLNCYFYKHGRFCASHPVEVIVCTVTLSVCLVSVGIFTTPDKICGWNYECAKEQERSGGNSDHIVLSVVKVAAVLFTYLQFRSLRKFGTKYLLGISGIFTLSSSMVFSIAIIKMFGNDLSGLTEALPFFLLLIDLSKACALAQFALKSSNQQEVQNNIAKGMSVHGPAMTLDAICEVLVIGVGTLSDVMHLEMMCIFGCLAVLANYLAFIMLYPACLALFLEVVRKRNKGHVLKHLKRLSEILHNEENDIRPNPVTQNVKVIMSAGLMMVHVHSHFIAAKKPEFLVDISKGLVDTQYREPDVSLWYFYIQRLFTVKADSTFTLVLAIFLIVKYAFFDENTAEIDDLTNAKSLPAVTPDITVTSVIPESVTPVVTDTPTSLKTPMVEFREDRTIRKYDSRRTSRVIFSIDEESKENEADNQGISVATQTETDNTWLSPLQRLPSIDPPRPVEECVRIMNSDDGPNSLTDEEIMMLVKNRHIPAYKIEKMIGDEYRGIKIRRQLLIEDMDCKDAIETLPYESYDGYELVNGACCENVLGYMPVPIGRAGPLLLDGKQYHVPMATTEGCLVASTTRGCKALEKTKGVTSVVIGDGMSRAPVVRLPSAADASSLKFWLEDTENFKLIKETFDETSRFARLKKLHIAQAGRLLYIRFIAKTGDAMGMNMLSKGAEKVMHFVNDLFPDMEVLSLSGNFCTDKKPAAVNWIEGRGKSVVCEAVIPSKIVNSVLKTTVATLVDLNTNKNLIGSAMAGSIGGFNAHAANIVTAIFIATGQDPAQSVTSSNCITLMERTGMNNEDLYVSCTMPCIEVGTVGGGTILPAQAACLKMLGVHGSNDELPGENARKLARVVCATVLAGELSLMGALAAGHLVRSHLKHNRSSLYLRNSCISNSSSSSASDTSSSETGKEEHSTILDKQNSSPRETS